MNMRNYTLTYRQYVYYNIEVTAENITEAKNKVDTMLEEEETDLSDHVAFYDLIELYEVEVEED